VNKKKGSDATDAMSEIKKGEPVTTFIIQVAALLWAATQVPEMTVAIQSLLKAGFRRAVQVELSVITPVTNRFGLPSFRTFAIAWNFVPKPDLVGYYQ